MRNNYVKRGWDVIKKQLSRVKNVYSLEKTKTLLLKDNLYANLFGRAKNRTLIKTNPILYKSIYHHTQSLEDAFVKQKGYKGWYNFKYRIKFIVEHDCCLDKLKCACGRRYTWTSYCRKCPEYHNTWEGKYHTDETRKKQRLSTIKYLSQTHAHMGPRYNVKSIPIIEEFGKKHGFNFRHAENGGEFFIKELGYWLDAYDEKQNVVLEIDERSHFIKGKLKESDVRRQKEITDLLGCRFYRLKI